MTKYKKYDDFKKLHCRDSDYEQTLAKSFNFSEPHSFHW